MQVGGRDTDCQVVARGVPLLRMRFDLADPFLASSGIRGRQVVFQAYDCVPVMPLAKEIRLRLMLPVAHNLRYTMRNGSPLSFDERVPDARPEGVPASARLP